MQRSGKWYRRNEREVMESFGLQPTKNSGSGWIEKEDGENENILCQLKSTDAHSIKINLDDLQKLEYHAAVAHKLPLFLVQFIGTGDVYCVVKPAHIADIADYIKNGTVTIMADNELGLDIGTDHATRPKRKTIASSDAARTSVKNEIENKYKKKHRSAT